MLWYLSSFDEFSINPGYAVVVVKQRTTRLTGRAGLHIARSLPACPANAGIIRKVWVKVFYE